MVLVLTLPSDSSMDWYPDNKISDFRVHLPHEFALEGEWEVGLVQLSYPHTWHTIPAKELDGHVGILTDGEMRLFNTPLQVTPGFYETPEAFVAAINNAIQEVIHSEMDELNICDNIELEGMCEIKHIDLQYNNITQKVKIKKSGGLVAMDLRLKLHPDLLFKLGFIPYDVNGERQYNWLKRGDASNSVVDLQSGFHNLYINCDLAQERVVGHTMTPLLRCIPISGKDGDIVLYEPRNIHWIPLKCSRFRTIHVYLNTDTGRRPPFETGKCVLTVEIRRRRILDR